MSIFESVISILAPHYCVNCGTEGFLLCEDCWFKLGGVPPEKCFSCSKLSPKSKTCNSCRAKSGLNHVYVRSEYKGIPKELVQMLKFKRVKQASRVIADSLLEILPSDRENLIIVAIPTASSRHRQRGYDQSILMAKDIAKKAGLPYRQFLKRQGQSRQVGTKKSIRRVQMKDAFRVVKLNQIANSHLILIDDVLTTGSTLESATEILKKAGAKTVDALIFARA